ncbi:MAG: hypothetical protein PF689_04765 [Deltaproteobacteria bacterium]|jgi:hypothetical protein|nr:hypothetical protein [Deltaproteobacteria bacterium]
MLPFIFIICAYVLMPIPFLILEYKPPGLVFNLFSILFIASAVLALFFTVKRKKYYLFALPPAGFAIFLTTTIIIYHSF